MIWEYLGRCASGAVLVSFVAACSGGGSPQAEQEHDCDAPSEPLSLSFSDDVTTSVDLFSDSHEFVVDGSCAPDGVSIDVTIDETTLASTICESGAWSAVIDTTALPNQATTTLVASVGDASVSINFFRDVVPPALALNALSDVNSLNDDAFAVSGSCAPNGASIAFSVGGSSVGSATCAHDVFSASLDVSTIADSASISLSALMDLGSGFSALSSASFEKNTSLGLSLADSSALPSVVVANVDDYSFSGSCFPDTSSVVVTVDGTAFASVACASGAWSTQLDLSAIAEGVALAVDVTLNDGDGASTSLLDSLLKDTQLPTFSFDTIVDVDAANVAQVALSGTCSNEGDAISIDIGAMTAALSTACVSGAWSGQVDLSALADASGIAVNASIDDGHNPAQFTSTTLDKDTSGPAVILNAPVAVTASNAAAYALSGLCSPDTTGAITVDFGGLSAVATTTCGATVSGQWDVTADVSAEADSASVSITVTIDDTVQTDVANANVIKDTAVPSVALNALVAANIANHGAYSISGTCDDASAVVTVVAGALNEDVACDGANFSHIFDLSSEADNAALAVSATITDAVGNSAADANAILKDTVEPLDGTGWALDPSDESTSTDITPTLYATGLSDEDGTIVAIFEEDTCSTQVGSATIASDAFSVDDIVYATDGSDVGAHAYYATTTDAAGNVRDCFDTTLNYTLESAGAATQPLLNLFGTGTQTASIVTIEAGTEFTYTSEDGLTVTDYGDAADPAGTIHSISNVTFGDRIDITSGAVMGITRAGSNMLPWASEGYAGTAFLYNVRNGQSSARIRIAALNSDASVNLETTSGATSSFTVSAGTVHEEVISSISGETGIHVDSDEPIVVGAYSGSNIDHVLVMPNGLDMVTVQQVRATEDDTTLSYYESDSTVNTGVNLASRGDAQNTGTLNQNGTLVASRVISDKPVSAYHRADGNGSDAVSGIPVSYFATHYALPEASNFIAVMTLGSGNVTVTESGVPTVLTPTRHASADPLAPYVVFDGTNRIAGTLITCDVPCAVIYDDQSQFDEEFLLGYTP